MMLHGAQSPSSVSPPAHVADSLDPSTRLRRKRKAKTQENERLSKRLSLLNLEQGGNKLYVPVETPSSCIPELPDPTSSASPTASQDVSPIPDDTMQLDDTKHKVYIYNIDDELSSDSESDDGKLVFLPDIDKHLRANRIPPSILANKDGELVGMQVVLYSDPKSLSVPEEKDSVRKAIIESRRRVREQQRLRREGKDIDEAATTVNNPIVNDGAMAAEGDDPDAMEMD